MRFVDGNQVIVPKQYYFLKRNAHLVRDAAVIIELEMRLIAPLGGNKQAMFIDTKTFFGLDELTANGLLNANTNPSGLSASGFRDKFWDRSPQPRHFIAGYSAGYLTGAGIIGYAAMGLNESGGWGMVKPGDDEQADIALNAISTILGARAVPTDAIYSGKTGQVTTPANPGYKVLADQIRRLICAE